MNAPAVILIINYGYSIAATVELNLKAAEYSPENPEQAVRSRSSRLTGIFHVRRGRGIEVTGGSSAAGTLEYVGGSAGERSVQFVADIDGGAEQIAQRV